jgi:hypothetical protein
LRQPLSGSARVPLRPRLSGVILGLQVYALRATECEDSRA